jgi:hypothetical protein
VSSTKIDGYIQQAVYITIILLNNAIPNSHLYTNKLQIRLMNDTANECLLMTPLISSSILHIIEASLVIHILYYQDDDDDDRVDGWISNFRSPLDSQSTIIYHLASE